MAISASSLSLLVVLLLWPSSFPAVAARAADGVCAAPLIAKEKRKIIASSDYGSVSAVDVKDGIWGHYHLLFFSLEPQALLVPLHLHADMVFYVHSGRGTVGWVSDGETVDLEVKRGDIYRIGGGSVFYVRSHADPLRQKLRIHAIFTPATEEAFVGAYSSLADLVRGFDEQVLRTGFRVSEEVISALKRAERPPAIVPVTDEKAADGRGWKEGVFEALIGVGRPLGDDNGKKEKKKKKKTEVKAFNILDAEPDVENCNGRSIAVTGREFPALKGSDVGVFMVNLTKGSMMGPHWNPRATEIAVATAGEGMVQVVLPAKEAAECGSWRFKVSEGDVFVVPRYHAMAQMSFNNASLSFVGFSTSVRKNRPQFLAGKRSVLQTLDRDVLALSLGVPDSTVARLLAPQGEAIMLECTSCAEAAAERAAEEMDERRREEEEAAAEKRREEEEEARRREEEEARRREKEEEARRREEEEARRREEEEEERKREEEEEEKRRREEEEERRREEEEEKRRREEEGRKREEEEEQRRREEEEEKRRRQEEEAARRREEEEEKRRREEEEEKQRREEEEEKRRREEEAEEEEKQRRREEEEEERRREEEDEKRRREEEDEKRRREEEEEEEKRREEEEGERRWE